MMKVNVKHVVEIAGGLVIGNLLGKAVNGVVNIAKKQVKKAKEKEAWFWASFIFSRNLQVVLWETVSSIG